MRRLLREQQSTSFRIWLPQQRYQELARRIDRVPLGVDETAEVVDRPSVPRAQGIAVPVDARPAPRARARAGRPDVAAEVEGLALLGADGRGYGGSSREGEHGSPHPPEERSARQPSGQTGRESVGRTVDELVRPPHAPLSPLRWRRAALAAPACSRFPWPSRPRPRYGPRRASPELPSARTSPGPRSRRRRERPGLRARARARPVRAGDRGGSRG